MADRKPTIYWVLGAIQILIVLAQGVGLYIVEANYEAHENFEKRLDTLDLFATEGMRFTQREASSLATKIAERDAEMDKRIAVLERELGHLWRTHHPNENSSFAPPENLAGSSAACRLFPHLCQEARWPID
jgi:hypothetical protein